MADGDRLSSLSDDLLRRILHFAPAKVGASTSALARRWRSVWRSCGAVNLDSRWYGHRHRCRRHYEIMRDLDEALAATHGRLTNFAFRYEDDLDELRPVRRGSSNYYDDRSYYHNEELEDVEHQIWDDALDAKGVMEHRLWVLLYSPASRHVEELRLGLFYSMRDDTPTWLYNLSICALSCSPSLRVLFLSKCKDHLNSSPPAAGGSMAPLFPRLVELRLHLCSVSLDLLQGVIDAAPQLAILHLNRVEYVLPSPTRYLHLRCPKITDLVLKKLDCCRPQCMEVEAPLLRCFTYEGPIQSLSLKSSPPPDLATVDLWFHVPAQLRTADGTWQLFWELMRSLSGASTINLNFHY